MRGPHAHYTDVARHYELYRKELEFHGYSIKGRDTPMTRLIAVAETAREAEEIARQGARWLVGSYVNLSHSSFMLFTDKVLPQLL